MRDQHPRASVAVALLLRFGATTSLGTSVAGCASPKPGVGSPPAIAVASAPSPGAEGNQIEGGPQGPAQSSATTSAHGLGRSDVVGAKLSDVHAVVAPRSPASDPPTTPLKSVHGHDPGRGPADIRAIVLAHRDEARACYDAAATNHPGIEGDLVIEWTIDPRGVVREVSLDSSHSQVLEPSVVGCVGNVIKSIQFAPSNGGFETKAFYPFNFHPRHTKPVAP